MTNEQEVRPLHRSNEAGNKPWATGAESLEPRKRTEGNTGGPHMCRTQSRASVSQGLELYERLQSKERRNGCCQRSLDQCPVR